MTDNAQPAAPPAPKKRQPRTSRGDAIDLEATAIHRCSVALRALDGDAAACQRVLDYVTKRFVKISPLTFPDGAR